MNMDIMNFDDLIIDSAKSIATASQALIQAASVAQKELVGQGKVASRLVKGTPDGQWSEGLISAAKVKRTYIINIIMA